jgi:hypothetical protein
MQVTDKNGNIFGPNGIQVNGSDGKPKTTGGGGGATWGSITGTLSAQTDLQGALDNKVPYTGATADVNLGSHDLTATQGTFATGGSSDTLTVNHTSGSGKAITITKGGSGEGIYVNKTSGSGNAVTIVGDLEATNIKKTSGTSTQFLKADGSVDTTTYQPTLVSATNIKTINGSSILGSGDLTISGSNIYTANGTLTAARTLTQGGFDLTIAGTTSSRFFSNGNVGIGTTTDAGFKLNVNGTARVQGQITTTTANAQFGTLGASTGVFRIDGVNGAGYAFSVYSSSTLRFAVVGFGGVLMPNGFTIVTGSTDLTTTRLRIGTGNVTGAINIQAQAGNTDIASFKASNGGDQFTIKNTSGNVLIGTSTDIASSKVTIQSTTQGFLPPRMTTAQKNAIASPAAGLVVYDTTLNKLCVRTASTWETITSL